MDDKTVSTQPSTEPAGNNQVAASENRQATIPVQEREHRQAYGTAKTEDLRDSGLWRTLLPIVVILFCIALFAIPLMILLPLLFTSLDPHSASRLAGVNLIWVWITLIVIAIVVAAVIVWGLIRIFLTQAGNYTKV